MKSKASKILKNILSITVVGLVKLEVLVSWDVQNENYRQNDFNLLQVFNPRSICSKNILLVKKNNEIGKLLK